MGGDVMKMIEIVRGKIQDGWNENLLIIGE